jgi:hypothetical protein
MTRDSFLVGTPDERKIVASAVVVTSPSRPGGLGTQISHLCATSRLIDDGLYNLCDLQLAVSR